MQFDNLIIISVLLLSLEILRKNEVRLVVEEWTGGQEFLMDNKPDTDDQVYEKNPITAIRRKELNKTVTTVSVIGNLPRLGCCTTLSISSSGVTAKWYPHVLGVYKLQAEEERLLYKMVDSQKYLSRPSKGIKNFTWGVNPNPELTWGWIKAIFPGKCPNDVKDWAAFDKKNKRMISDKTLVISCRK